MSARRGLQRVEVAFGDGGRRRAYVLTALIGPVDVGDRVVVNTTAVELGLGTGGWDFVHWNLSREEWSEPGGGHVMKLRYTSLQADVGVAEEHDDYDPPGALGGTPVVACAVHSQLAPVVVALHHAAPTARVAYVMTDAAALALPLSDLVAALVDAARLATTVTAGQAFGGDHEAVTVRSALDVALVHGRADAIVVAPGPGGVGTSTARGFGAMEVASVLDLTAAGGGRPIAALRWSTADPRPRHQGLSHHSLTALEHTHARVCLPAPRGHAPAGLPAHHDVVEVDVPDIAALLADLGIAVTSMGRGPADDPLFFAFAAAAGTAAAGMLAS